MIVSPLNGSVYEVQEGERRFLEFKRNACDACDDRRRLLSRLGSAEEMFCRVLAECEAADATEVAWLVNGQPVASSYLDGRALQGGRRCLSTLNNHGS